MDEAADQIDHLIDVMKQLKSIEQHLYNKSLMDDDYRLMMGLILALIHNTRVPDVTILSNIRSMAQA